MLHCIMKIKSEVQNYEPKIEIDNPIKSIIYNRMFKIINKFVKLFRIINPEFVVTQQNDKIES